MDDASFIGPYVADVHRLLSRCKIYYHDKIIFISNEHHQSTFITEVNLLTGETKHKVFNQVATGNIPKVVKVTSFNSFLYNNVLVNGNLYNETLSLSFYNYDNGNLLKNYLTPEDDTINFKNGPIVSRERRELTKTSEFIKKAIIGGWAFTLAATAKDETALVVQTYSEQGGGGGGGFSPGMPGSSFSTPGGVISTPGLPGHFTSFGSGITGSPTTAINSHFKCIFNPGTFEHIEKNDDDVKSVGEKTDDELNKSGKKEAISTFVKDNYLYLGFYDSSNETYTIARMGKLAGD